MGPLLSVPLLLKHDISEAAGAPKRSGEEMTASGESKQSKQRLEARGTGKSELGGGVRKKINQVSGVCLLPTEV